MKRNVIFGILFFVMIMTTFGSQTDNATRRFGIFIGSNNGGRDRVTLRYAVSDARSIANVFSQMGGIAGEDSILLVDPNIREINRRIDAMHEQVLNTMKANRRTEIIFYYSGHSDDEGLLLNREKYYYRELREKINNIPSDMRIVILDSCASGAFTRIKGGEKTLPFLLDSSSTAEGYAFLTSSSANESSQESDRIASSYFTHSLVAGLRGAADSVGDGRVTLNELYRYAYAETMARTETSLYGTQHPSYDIQINGSGDLVLTDVNQTSAGIVIDEKITGRLTIRDDKDRLIVEINKTARVLELGLEPGIYSITLQQGVDLFRAEITLVQEQRTLVSMKDFNRIGTAPARRRGGDEKDDAAGTNLYTFFFNIVYEPFPLPLIGFVNIAIGNHKYFQASFVNWNTENFSGFQTGFINTVGGNFNGFQAGFVNTIAGDTKGLQVAFVNTNVGEIKGMQTGFFNTAVKKMEGVQTGFVNIATRDMKGLQVGFVNYAESIDGAPIGFISIVKNGGYMAVEYFNSEYHNYNLSFKTGIDKLYTSIVVSYNQTDENTWNNFASGVGIGSILPIGKIFYFNPELTSLAPSINNFSYESFVPYFGVNFKKFSIAAGPVITWVRRHNKNNVDEPEGYPAWVRIDTGNYNDNKDNPLPKPNYSLYYHEINDNNSLSIGFRAAARLRF